jgi:hypothetical protein
LYKADLVGNIILGCQKPGLSLDTHTYYRGAFNVFNNTFYGNELRPGTADSGAEVLVQAMNAGTTLTLANNIMAHLAVTGSQSSSLSVQIGFAGSFAHHHNLFWNSAGSAASLVYNMGALHTAGTIASYESTGLASEPLFINTNDLPTTVSRESGGSPEGLGLTLSSPAINKGADLGPLYAQDIQGLARPQGAAWDMGAYETVISPGPPTNVHVIP